MDLQTTTKPIFLSERLSPLLQEHPPELDEILGAVCQLYRVSPDDIDTPGARPARRLYCYCAARWSRLSNPKIGDRIGIDPDRVGDDNRFVRAKLTFSPTLSDDLDMITIHIVERVWLRKRRDGT
jgi:hypothetical protein